MTNEENPNTKVAFFLSISFTFVAGPMTTRCMALVQKQQNDGLLHIFAFFSIQNTQKKYNKIQLKPVYARAILCI